MIQSVGFNASMKENAKKTQVIIKKLKKIYNAKFKSYVLQDFIIIQTVFHR